LALDVDGVLTSGKFLYSTEKGAMSDFSVHDGLGMRLLQETGVPIAIISARSSKAVTNRMADLGITHVFQGQREKMIAFKQLQKIFSFEESEMAYMGDDLPDLPLLRKAGFSCTVPNAPSLIQEHVDWVAQHQGGQGAV